MATTKKSKDAAQTASKKAKPGSGDKLRKQAIAEIGDRIKTLDAGGPVGHNEQVSVPDKPAPKKPKGPKAAKATKPKKAKEPKAPKPKRLGVLDAAAQVIAGLKEPVGVQALIEEVGKRGLWRSPSGKTPAATLYAGIIREIAAKGRESRFKKHDRGLFVAGKVA